MVGNVTANSHANHVDIKYKYVNSYVEDCLGKSVLLVMVHFVLLTKTVDIKTAFLSSDLKKEV